MSIQPVNKAAEHLINSTPVLEEKQNKTKTSLFKGHDENRQSGRESGSWPSSLIFSKLVYVLGLN